MKALKLLKAAFKLNPQVPSKMKVALGYCFFTLDKVKKAQKAFEYAIESVFRSVGNCFNNDC